MNTQENNPENVTGTVIEALPETRFKVLTEDGTETMAYLAGKMRMHRIKVLVGDTVEMKLDPYGGKARIFKRL
jgi:translation initiation factor IF-1